MVHPKGFVRSFLSIAKGQVGRREVGDNGGAAVRAYQSATWLEPGAWKWCAAFVCWVYQAAALHWPDLTAIRPKTPRAFEFEDWGHVHATLMRDANLILPGDIVIFSFSHVGIAASPVVGGVFQSIEGNTDASGGRDGDGVCQRPRHISLVRSFVRIVEAV